MIPNQTYKTETFQWMLKKKVVLQNKLDLLNFKVKEPYDFRGSRKYALIKEKVRDGLDHLQLAGSYETCITLFPLLFCILNAFPSIIMVLE